MSDLNPYIPKLARQTEKLSIRGVDHCINLWGAADSPQLFYLHGWADTGATFQFVVDAFANDWRVIAPDWRGFGRSAHAGESYWFPDYLADLHEILQHYSPKSSVQLLGHSMGANIGSLYAGTMPDRVRDLVNLEGFGLNDSDPDDAPQRYRDWIEAGSERPVFARYPDFNSLAQRIARRSPGIDSAQAEFVARQWARKTRDGDVELRTDPVHKLPNPVLYRRTEAEACWRNISANVLLVYGEESPFADKFGSTGSLPFPNAETAGIAAARHMLHFEAPIPLAGLIERFLRKPL